MLASILEQIERERYGGMSSVIPVVGVNVNVAFLGRCKHVLRVHYICSFIIYVPLKKNLRNDVVFMQSKDTLFPLIGMHIRQDSSSSWNQK